MLTVISHDNQIVSAIDFFFLPLFVALNKVLSGLWATSQINEFKSNIFLFNQYVSLIYIFNVLYLIFYL